MDTEELNIEIVKLEKRWKRVGRCPGTEVVVDQYRHNLDREKLNVLNGDIILSPLTGKHGKRVFDVVQARRLLSINLGTV